MSNHDAIQSAYDTPLDETPKSAEKGVKASAARARKALGELGKMCKERRKEIQDKKNSM